MMRFRSMLGLPPYTPPANDPLGILGANCLQWCRADLGITVVTGVSQWLDQSGNARDYVQATTTLQPLFTANDATLNNQPTMLFDGGNDQLSCAGFNLPAPGTTPTWVWMMVKAVTWANNDRIVSAVSGTEGVMLYQFGSTPAVVQFGASNSNSNTGLTVGAWHALAAGFTNSTSDFTKVDDAAAVTGANAGNNASTGRRIGNNPSANAGGNIALAEIVYANVIPSAPQIAAFAAYRLARYGF